MLILLSSTDLLPLSSSQTHALPDESSLKGLLRDDTVTLHKGKLLHSDIVSRGLDKDVSLSNHIVSMYGKFHAVADARSVFDHMHTRDLVSWNAMIAVYANCFHAHTNNSNNEAFCLFKHMCGCGFEPDVVTFISILRACHKDVDLSHGELIHASILDYGFESNSVVCTALLNMYGRCDALEFASILFHKLQPCRETIPWNAIIAAYSQQGYHEDALEFSYDMERCGITPDKVTFISVVTACANLHCFDEGKRIHLQIQDYGFDSDVVVCNALITMYGNCVATKESRIIFDRMPQRDLTSWNAMLGAYARDTDGVGAIDLFKCMRNQNVQPNAITYVSLLSACGNMASILMLQDIHACTVSDGYELNDIVSTELLNNYGKCGDLESARIIFNKIPQHSLVSWNVMISVYAQNGEAHKAIELIHRSSHKGIQIDEVSLVCALTACQDATALEEGRILHAKVLDTGFDCNIIVENAIVTMYGKCEALEDACLFFETMHFHNVVTWNIIMDAHVQSGKGDEVLGIFKRMKTEGFKPDQGTYVSALGGCAITRDLSEGRFTHMCIVIDGLRSEILEGALMNMYGKCGSLDDAEVIFQNMNETNIICWNNIIALYSSAGHNKEALMMFKHMQYAGVMPNKVTLMTILNACIDLTALDEAQVIHGYVVLCGFETDAFIGTALMNTYGKFGALEDARNVFDRINDHDVIAWNALISVYAQQGHAEQSLQTFEEMISKKVRPDTITFVNLLSSCSHGGLLEEGLKFFHAMWKDYNVKPSIEHYGCVVDLYGRAGQLAEAEDFITKCSLEKQPLVWTNLLGACRLYDDVERGKRAAKNILHLEAQDSATYVLLASMC